MRRLRKIVKVTLWSAFGLVSVAVLLGVGLALRLASGPIETPIPQSLLDRVVAEAAPGWRVVAGGAELDFSSEDGLNGLKLRDVVVFDTSGSQVVKAPALGLRFAVSASLNPAEALTIREVALNGASVDVIRDENGVFQLALGEMATSGGSDDPLASLSELGSYSDLPQLRVEDAQVRYTDLARGTSWQTEKAQLILSPMPKGLSGSLGVVIDGGIGGAQLDAFHTAETGEVSATLTLNEVRPSRIADLDPIFAQLARIDALLSGTVTLAADDGGSFRNITARLRASQGQLTIGAQPIEMESFAASVSCNVPTMSCDVAGLVVKTSDFSGSATGSFKRFEEGVLAVDMTVDKLSIRQSEALVTIGSSAFVASFDATANLVTLESAALERVAVSGLPNETTAALASLNTAGTIDLNTSTFVLPLISAGSVVLTDAQGASQTLESLEASLKMDTEAEEFAVSEVNASNLSVFGGGLAAAISKLSGAFSFDLAENLIKIDALSASNTRFERDGAKPSVIGSAVLQGTVDLDALNLSDGRLRFDKAILSLPELYAKPMRVDAAKLALAAVYEDGVTQINLTKAAATINGLAAAAKAKLSLRADGSALGQVEASVERVSLSELPKHWPLGVAPGGLSWVAENVRSGVANSLIVKAQFDEARPDKDTLDLRFKFKDALVSFAPTMPPIKSATGTGKVTLDRFDLSLSDGHVDAPKAGPLSLKGSSFAIADFSPDIPNGEVKLRASGNIQSVLRLLDSEPLGVISPTGFDISTAEGRADVRVMLELPLSEDLKVDDVRFDARAKIHKYNLIEPEAGLEVSGDLLQVKATPKGLTLQSDARIGGLAARLGYSLGFDKSKDGEPDSVLTLESFLSLEDFARHGLVLDDYVEGLTAMKARVEMFEGGAATINADADLTNLTLKAEQVGWSKSAGLPATVRLSGFRNPNGAGRIQALALRGEGISADGSIGFDQNGQVTRANFSRVILGSAVDTGLVYGRKTNGDVGILVKGARLDLRRSFAAALEGETSPRRKAANSKATDISVQVGRVFLRDDLGVFDLKGGIRLRGGELHAANISGKLNGSAATKVLVERRAEGMAIRLTAPDAGAFIRATDLFVGAYDGVLTLDALRRDAVSPAQISGTALVTNMVVHDAPTLGRILSGGAIGSLMSDLADGGIKFSKIQLPFRGIGSSWRVENGVAVGPQIGLTLDGGYNVANRKLALNGSVSPAYAINGALGNVPLLGRLLTGGEGEGVFGVTFRVDGDTDKPIVDVNPLSALAPGFLRKMVAEAGRGGAEFSAGSGD